MTNVILSQSMLSFPSKMAANKHETLQAKNVAEKSHFLPLFAMMYMAMHMAGTSTRPESACWWKHKKKIDFFFFIR